MDPSKSSNESSFTSHLPSGQTTTFTIKNEPFDRSRPLDFQVNLDPAGDRTDPSTSKMAPLPAIDIKTDQMLMYEGYSIPAASDYNHHVYYNQPTDSESPNDYRSNFNQYISSQSMPLPESYDPSMQNSHPNALAHSYQPNHMSLQPTNAVHTDLPAYHSNHLVTPGRIFSPLVVQTSLQVPYSIPTKCELEDLTTEFDDHLLTASNAIQSDRHFSNMSSNNNQLLVLADKPINQQLPDHLGPLSAGDACHLDRFFCRQQDFAYHSSSTHSNSPIQDLLRPYSNSFATAPAVVPSPRHSNQSHSQVNSSTLVSVGGEQINHVPPNLSPNDGSQQVCSEHDSDQSARLSNGNYEQPHYARVIYGANSSQVAAPLVKNNLLPVSAAATITQQQYSVNYPVQYQSPTPKFYTKPLQQHFYRQPFSPYSNLNPTRHATLPQQLFESLQSPQLFRFGAKSLATETLSSVYPNSSKADDIDSASNLIDLSILNQPIPIDQQQARSSSLTYASMQPNMYTPNGQHLASSNVFMQPTAIVGPTNMYTNHFERTDNQWFPSQSIDRNGCSISSLPSSSMSGNAFAAYDTEASMDQPGCTFDSNSFNNLLMAEQELLASIGNHYQQQQQLQQQQQQLDDHSFSNTSQLLAELVEAERTVTAMVSPDDGDESSIDTSMLLDTSKKIITLHEAANVKLEKVKIERANGMKIYYFKCSLCDYQTNTSQSMKDHLYCIHCKAKNNYKCNICHQTFGWKNNAQRHMRRKHKIEDQTTKREAIITLI